MFSISWVAAWTFFSPAIFSSSKVRSLARYSSYRCYWSSFIFISSAYSFYNCFSFTYSSSSWCSVAFLSKADISAYRTAIVPRLSSSSSRLEETLLCSSFTRRYSSVILSTSLAAMRIADFTF
jgi:hypothetical protein